MEKELDPEVIKLTQASLGKYVKRPPLTEKLLKKPPFRFLHDIVTTVLKTTGFFEGLFEEEELVSDNVKDRDIKILFLTKVISVVGATTGKTLLAKPSKIVAGQEADKTNELLQCLAQALDKKLSSDDAVKKYKDGGNLQQASEKKTKEVPKAVKKTNERKLTSKSSEKLTTVKREQIAKSTKNGGDKGNSITKTRQKDTPKAEIPSKKSTQQPKTLSKKGSIEKNPQAHVDKLQRQEENVDNNEIGEINTKNKTEENISITMKDYTENLTDGAIDSTENVLEDQNDHESFSNSQINENQLNSSLSSQDLLDVEKTPESTLENMLPDEDTRRSQIPNNKDNDDKKEPTVINNVADPIYEVTDNGKSNTNNDTTILKSPIKNNNANITRPLSVRPSSSRPGAPRLRDKHENVKPESENLIVGKVNIITENTTIEEEEDSSVIIIEQDTNPVSTVQKEQEHVQLSSKNHHGHLVQQILESQKEFSQMTGKTEIEWEFGAQKAREAMNREIEQLRYNIQGLSRVANPLGKLLDHIQEDVEVMRQELQQWTKTYDEASKELSKQKTINEDSLIPLRSKVKQLESDIEEKHEKINDLKIVIHKNSIRIEKLLASGDVQ